MLLPFFVAPAFFIAPRHLIRSGLLTDARRGYLCLLLLIFFVFSEYTNLFSSFLVLGLSECCLISMAAQPCI